MRTRSVVGALLAVLSIPISASAATYYVASDGDDDDAGSMGAPWLTLQHAADTVAEGDTVVVRPGGYAGFYLEASGSDGAPITFSAEEGVEITSENPETPDGINLEGASYVIVEGFTVNGMERAGVRAVTGDHVTLRGNRGDANGRWGILTGFVDDLLIEENWMSGSIDEHGIYVSNSGDRPIIRRNVVWGNNANGIHMNGDAEQGGDGIISNALVEGNVIYSNGMAGGSGINCDGVQDSLIVNNLIYDAHASGISLYQIDGGGPASDNQVINNTIVVASDGRWALNIQDDSSGTTIYNNVFLNLHPSRGAISLCGPGCEDGLISDYNVVTNRFTRDDDSVSSLADWQAATGQDANSVLSDSDAVFLNAAGDDYHPAEDGPAVDAGTAMEAPDRDLDGNARPLGDGFDIGAYERCVTDCVPASGGTGGSSGGGGEAGTPDATGGDGNSGSGGASAGSGAANGGSGAATAGSNASGGASAGGGAGGSPAAGRTGAGGTSPSGGTNGGGSGGRSGGSGGANSGGAGTAGGAADGGDDNGCSCRVGAGPESTRFGAFAAVALGLLLRRRRGAPHR